MSDDQTLTLSSFFNVKEAIREKAQEFMDESFLKEFTAQVGEGTKGMKLPPTFSKDLLNLMLDKIDALIDIDIPRDIWAKAWSVHQALMEYRDPLKHPPEETGMLPLSEHAVDSEHKPAIEPKVFGKTFGKFAVQANAQFQFNGAILEIREARIKKVSLSDVKGKLKLTFFGKPLLEKDSSLKIPGVFDLKEGVEIRDPFERKTAEETTDEVMEIPIEVPAVSPKMTD